MEKQNRIFIVESGSDIARFLGHGKIADFVDADYAACPKFLSVPDDVFFSQDSPNNFKNFKDKGIEAGSLLSIALSPRHWLSVDPETVWPDSGHFVGDPETMRNRSGNDEKPSRKRAGFQAKCGPI